MSLNYIVLLGNVIQNPELRFTTGGTSVGKFSIGVERLLKEGAESTIDYIKIASYGKLADNVTKDVKKGDVVIVEGRLITKLYEDKGQKNKTVEVEAFSVNSIKEKKNFSQLMEDKKEKLSEKELPF